MKTNFIARLVLVAVAACGLAKSSVSRAADTATASGQHPLAPALEMANRGLESLRGIKDYSCTLVKRENVNGKLLPPEFIFAKVRHEPFSVYMHFLGPEDMKGREVIYVHGKNDNALIAHEAKGLKARFGAVHLKPTSMLAMQGNRYPITEVGILNLTRRLVEVANEDMKYGECTVNFFKDGKVNDRKVTCIQVMHPVPRRNFRFHLARVYVDDELHIPIRYEAYDWPHEQGGKPVLWEEYTYSDLKLNVGFTDADFDINNPNYRFK